jgi:glycosyltransferase involved in cell wall biosynthesis
MTALPLTDGMRVPLTRTAPAAALPSVAIFWGRPDRGAFMARGLRERGFPVVHYNVARYGDDPVVPLRASFSAACARVLATDHDVYFSSLSFVPALCLWVNRRLRGRPYVFNCTGVMWEMFRDRARGRPFATVFERGIFPGLARLILDGAARIVCNSRFLETTLVARYPTYASKVSTIYNGIDIARYAGGQPTPIAGIPPDAPVVLCVTTLNFENKARGLDLVLDAFARVVTDHPRARLVVAAKVSHRRYAARAARRLQEAPWGRQVVLLENATCVPDLLARCDVFAFATAPDSNDSLPRVLLEAQAAGRPCVATATTGCAEVVQDGVTGFVVPYEAAAMASRVGQLLADAPLRRCLGAAAPGRLATTFTWDGMADGYARLFCEVAR